MVGKPASGSDLPRCSRIGAKAGGDGVQRMRRDDSFGRHSCLGSPSHAGATAADQDGAVKFEKACMSGRVHNMYGRGQSLFKLLLQCVTRSFLSASGIDTRATL